jgi:hypothetical protein
LKFGLALAVFAASAFLVPAAGVASTHGSTGVSCQSVGKQPLGTAGAVSVKTQGSNIGTPVTCTAKLTGKWAKNSKTFTITNSGHATTRANGAWTMDPGTDLSPLTNAKVTGVLGGTGLPEGTALYVNINCVVSYPPLKIVCTITIGTGSPSKPAFARTAAPTALPHAKLIGTTQLCGAGGGQPLANKGVVNLKLKNTNAPGAPDSCYGKIVGKWTKNSTAFSFADEKVTTIDAAGNFTALSSVPFAGKLTGTLVGSGLPEGSNITVDWGCDISYPPLKIKCWIIVSTA